ncbi:hypothetical protein HJFPF1_13512 [Paramyrothecium foliicola]|nr:hypothetical protein HJFPF1_13512 [Paramyrothecium foliicola]
MNDISQARIHEDAIIFSAGKLNAWNATIQRGSIIILGGDREVLRDVLNYKKTVASKPADNFVVETESQSVMSSSPPSNGDFLIIGIGEREDTAPDSTPYESRDMSQIATGKAEIIDTRSGTSNLVLRQQ